MLLLAVVSFNHTPYPVVCPGDELVFTCVAITTSGSIVWRIHNGAYEVLPSDSQPMPLGSFLLNVTSYNISTQRMVSTATAGSAPIQLNGTSIECSGNVGQTFEKLYINYQGNNSTLIMLHSFCYRTTRSSQ